jgi:hypothetical protein
MGCEPRSIHALRNLRRAETPGGLPRPTFVGLSFDDFRALACELARREDLTIHGLLPIPALRRQCEGQLSRPELDGFLVRLHAEGTIHLLSHVEFGSLPEAARREALRLPPGPELYWIRWL